MSEWAAAAQGMVLLALAFSGGYAWGRLVRVRWMARRSYSIDLSAALHEAGLVLMTKEAMDELVDQAIAAEPAVDEPASEATH